MPQTVAEVWQWLGTLPDPEIPVISLTDLGVIREVAMEGERLVVTVTPTYSGCPATAVIRQDIEQLLRARGVGRFEVRHRLSPPWTTDWISEAGRTRLRAHGIAPPQRAGPADDRLAARIQRLVNGADPPAVPCPRCGDKHTVPISQFGSTPCKATWRCTACREPFDYFKCI